eukprot:scaffold145676_cov30-Tisochrysis_lutea.AAC.4
MGGVWCVAGVEEESGVVPVLQHGCRNQHGPIRSLKFSRPCYSRCVWGRRAAAPVCIWLGGSSCQLSGSLRQHRGVHEQIIQLGAVGRQRDSI